jgi:ornithine--oxo-acid transaminase
MLKKLKGPAMQNTPIKLYDTSVLGFSNITDDAVYALERKFGANHYDRLNVSVRTARGSWITDINGRKYLDCLAAYSAVNLGHHHPKVVNAIMRSLVGNYASVISNVVYTDSLALFLSKTAEFVPQLGPRFGMNGNKVLPKNGGVESVETAIKMARYYGFKEKNIPDGKQELIVFNNNFHGRMITVISFSTQQKYRAGFGPLTPGFVSVEFGNLDAVKAAINENTCGILVEPLQGEGGMRIPPAGFLKGLREIADDHDLLLLLDEIQVGLGRTGKNFCFQHEDVVPDGLILGKALSGGLVPLSAFVTNARLIDLAFHIGSDGSTFGGYPLACVAGVSALEVLQEEQLVKASDVKGKKLKQHLLKIAVRSKDIKEVRGKGLFIGIEVKHGNAIMFCRKLLELGIIVNDSHGHTIRISPPLNISDNEIGFLVECLEKVFLK